MKRRTAIPELDSAPRRSRTTVDRSANMTSANKTYSELNNTNVLQRAGGHFTIARRLLCLSMLFCLICAAPLAAQVGDDASNGRSSNSTLTIDENGDISSAVESPDKASSTAAKTTTSTIDLPQDSRSIEARSIDAKRIDALRDLPEYRYNIERPEQPSLWDELWYWLLDHLLSPIGENSQITPLELIGYVLIVFAVILLVRVLMGGAFFGLIGRRDKSTEIEYATGAEEDIESMSLEAMLNEALARENYRAAVRYRFLMLLRELARQDKIAWRREKTNSRYLAEIQDPELKQMFRKAAWWFDLAWYGEWNLTAADEAQIAQVFRDCMARLGDREAART